MRIGFLGHNGFALGGEERPVLVDPILFPRYGEEYTSSPVEIYPPRTITLDRMPPPAAVIISHEHSDHFHLPSLAQLDRATPILVGPTMIASVVEYISELGFTVERLPFGEPATYGSVVVTLYPPGDGTVLWESRVSQVYATDAADPELGGFYLCIDALMSQRFIDDVNEGTAPAPVVIAVSNNAQVTPAGVFGSLDQLDPRRAAAARRPSFQALDILQEIIVETLSASPAFHGSHMVICGGGFLKDYEQMGPFPFSEQKDLAAVAKRLVRHIDVVGPEPGEVLEPGPDGVPTVGPLSWLGADRDRFVQLRRRRESFIDSGQTIPMKRITSGGAEAERSAVEEVLNGLDYLAKAILLAPLGQDMVRMGRTHPLIVKLLCQHSEDRCVQFDLAAGAFEECDDIPLDTAMDSYPYGIVVHAVDMAAMLCGDLQIWDIVGVAMQSWYEGDALNSPVALMYDAFGEQVRPDIACRVYKQQLDYLAGQGAKR